MGTPDKSPECGCDGTAAQPVAQPTAAQPSAVRVLLIDDDEDDHFLTAERLGDVPGRPYQLEWTAQYAEGLDAICAGAHDVYLLDYRLGARTGIDLLREAHERGCSGPVILLTGQGQSRTDLEALDAGADDYLEKSGLTSSLLDRAIRYALAQHRAEAELEQKVAARTEELARANDALREADRRKDEFLATLAHELRNPLAPIRNSLEILSLAGDAPDAVRAQRERIERQVGHLQRLIEDLLDVSRITTGKMRLQTEPLALGEALEVALEASAPALGRAGVAVEVRAPDEPVRLVGDRVRLAQVFTNLLVNAAKFTESGGRVTVSVSVAGGTVSVAVADTGVGFPPELGPALFDLFTQGDRSLNRSQSGLGIGLALVRRLAEMHGGTATAASAGPGTGATFTVTLPIAEPRE